MPHGPESKREPQKVEEQGESTLNLPLLPGAPDHGGSSPRTPAAPSPRPLAKVGGGIRLRRAQAAICMQIAWNAMQMRDLMQMYALLGGRPRPSPHEFGDQVLGGASLSPWGSLSPLPQPSVPSPSSSPNPPLHQYLPLMRYLSPPGPFLAFLSVPPFSMSDNNNNTKYILNTCSVPGFALNTFHSYQILPIIL